MPLETTPPSPAPFLDHIALVKAPDTLATAWRGGRTRDEFNKPHAYDRLDTIRTKFGGKSTTPVQDSMWSCPPGHARALGLLDEEMRARGSRGVRLVELGRSWVLQAQEREKYDTWAEAGHPDPTSSRYVKERMRTTYLARPGESLHQSGCAIDIDVEALDFLDVAPRERLAVFWEIAKPLGWRPIIGQPDPAQSECWHFDWWPAPVARINSTLRARDRLAYPHTAMALAVLTGRFQGTNTTARLVQARLLLDGHDVGWTDGVIGPRTLAGLAAAGVRGVTSGTPAGVLLRGLDEHGVGVDAMGEI